MCSFVWSCLMQLPRQIRKGRVFTALRIPSSQWAFSRWLLCQQDFITAGLGTIWSRISSWAATAWYGCIRLKNRAKYSESWQAVEGALAACLGPLLEPLGRWSGVLWAEVRAMFSEARANADRWVEAGLAWLQQMCKSGVAGLYRWLGMLISTASGKKRRNVRSSVGASNGWMPQRAASPLDSAAGPGGSGGGGVGKKGGKGKAKGKKH